MYQCPRCRKTFFEQSPNCPHCGVGFAGKKDVDKLLPTLAEEAERERQKEQLKWLHAQWKGVHVLLLSVVLGIILPTCYVVVRGDKLTGWDIAGTAGWWFFPTLIFVLPILVKIDAVLNTMYDLASNPFPNDPRWHKHDTQMGAWITMWVGGAVIFALTLLVAYAQRKG
jgi:hypothetical protein